MNNNFKLTLSKRVLSAKESQTLAISAKAKAMKKEGKDIISLSTGEPDFGTPDCVKNAAIEAINANFSHYTESNGIPELKQAVAEKFINDNNVSADAANVLVSTGAKHSIFNVLSAICNDGDEVIIIAPYWVSYPAMTVLVGAVPVVINTSIENNFKATAEELSKAITDKTKAIIINSPSNPTGAMYSEQELREIAKVVEKSNAIIISDEIYEKINFGVVKHFSIGSIPEIADRVVTINGVSKAYAMTGWRIGYICGPAEIIKQAAKVQSQSTSNANSIAQKATLRALKSAAPDVENMRQEFVRRRELICSMLEKIDGIKFSKPDGAFYVFVNIKAILNDKVKTCAEFCEFLLDKHYLALVPGEAFGAEGHVRFSFAACDNDIINGVERFKNAIDEIKK